MSVTPGTRYLRAGVAVTFGLMIVRGTRPDADRLHRLSAVVLLATLVGDSERHHRELVHHHQALKLLTDVVDDVAVRYALTHTVRDDTRVYVHPGPYAECPRCVHR